MNNVDDTKARDIEPPKAHWLTPGVGAVGAASFFSDSGHELTTSVLPAFLTGTLGASAAALGIIDGISDALIGVMKLIGGPLANDPRRRARTASGGYLGTAVATGAIGAAATVWQVGALRAIAWLSRGLRSPARLRTAGLSNDIRQYGDACCDVTAESLLLEAIRVLRGGLW